jgi:ribose transport system substrate-binding protein
VRSSLLLLSLLVLLSGCQKSGKKIIAVVPKATSHLFWLSVQSGAMAAGEEYGVQVEWNGAASETDYTRQVQILDSFISRRVDGIAVAATERKILQDKLAAAKSSEERALLIDRHVALKQSIATATNSEAKK